MASANCSISDEKEPFETLNVQIKFVGVDVTKQTLSDKVLRYSGREFRTSRFGTWVLHEGDKEDDLKTILSDGGPVVALVWGIMKTYPEISVWVTDLKSYCFALDMKKCNKKSILDAIGKGKMGRNIERVLNNLTVTDAYKNIKIKLVKILRESGAAKETKPAVSSNETTEVSRMKKLEEAEKVERFMINENFSWAFVRLKTLLQSETDDTIRLQLWIRFATCSLHLKKEEDLESSFIQISKLLKTVVLSQELFTAYTKDFFPFVGLLKANGSHIRSIEILISWIEVTKQRARGDELTPETIKAFILVCHTINEFVFTDPGVFLKCQVLQYIKQLEKVIDFLKNMKNCDSLTIARNVYHAETALEITRNIINERPGDLNFGKETKEFIQMAGCWADFMFASTSLYKDTRTSHLIMNEDFCTIVREISKNPNLLKEKLSDPRVALANEVLMSHSDKIGGATTSKNSPMEEVSKSGMFGGATGRTEPNKSSSVNSTQKSKIEKDKGNEAYRKKKFEEAIQHYNRAILLDPSNVMLHSNKAAVYIEQSKLDLARLSCATAINMVQNGCYVPEQDLAKIAARGGRIEMLANNFYLAVQLLKDSLDLHYNPQVKEQLDICKFKLISHPMSNSMR